MIYKINCLIIIGCLALIILLIVLGTIYEKNDNGNRILCSAYRISCNNN